MSRRPCSSAVGYPTIHVQNPSHGDISDDDRNSVTEYYSGDEFHEDDVMLARDRYRLKTLFRKCMSIISYIKISSLCFSVKVVPRLSGHSE